MACPVGDIGVRLAVQAIKEAKEAWAQAFVGVNVFPALPLLVGKQQDVIYFGFMSAWVHNICLDCWCAQQKADGLTIDLSSEEGPEDVCCWCGKRTSSGIYQRADPEETRCNGNHNESRNITDMSELVPSGRAILHQIAEPRLAVSNST